MAVVRDAIDSIMHRRCSAQPDSDLFATIGSFARTSAEISAGVTPVNYAYAPDPIADVRRYGWIAGGSASTNTTALNAGLSVLTNAGGGILQLPKGSYNINDSHVISAGIIVRGAGQNGGTTLTSGSTGNPVFALGSLAATGVNKYGCGLMDLQIILTQTNGKAIRLMETVGAELRNIYTQGPIAVSRSTAGVIIDGGNVGSFFNLIQNVECAHYHVGFDQLTSGTTAPTTQTYINISATGDVATDTTSIGYRLSGASNTGEGTTVLGCDFEACKYGMYFTASCGSSTNVGCRGEGNSTANVYIETSAGAQTFFGGILNIANSLVMVNNGTLLNTTNGSGLPHRFWGSMNGSNLPDASFWAASNFFYGQQSGDTPAVVVAAPGDTTSKVIQVQNSSATVLASIDASGNAIAATSKVTAATPTGSGSQVSFGNTTAASATAGSSGAIPAQVAGYLVVDFGGTKQKIPYFNT